VGLDGTLAEHYWPHDGPYESTRIGKPIPEMVDRVKAWIADGSEVRIFTARVGPVQPDGSDDIGPVMRAIWKWTKEHVGVELDATCMKDYGMIELWDDRAVQVLCDTGFAVPRLTSSGAAAVAFERERQMSAEGYTPEHDDAHIDGALADAAACYLVADVNGGHPGVAWPWLVRYWRPKSRILNLVRAGALISAEIDRLLRAGVKP
jgi:hypothetical protein